MNLTIGSTTLEITSCIRMRDVQRGFYLDIKIPRANIAYDELEALLSDCSEAIVITEGENETTYNGFKLLHSITVKDGVYQVVQCCVSEIEAQLSLAQKKIADQDNVISNQAQLIATLQEDNAALSEELLNTQLALCELYEQSLETETVESEVE